MLCLSARLPFHAPPTGTLLLRESWLRIIAICGSRTAIGLESLAVRQSAGALQGCGLLDFKAVQAITSETQLKQLL